MKPLRSSVRMSATASRSASRTKVASAKSMGVSAYRSIISAAARTSAGSHIACTCIPLRETNSLTAAAPLRVRRTNCMVSVSTAAVVASVPTKPSMISPMRSWSASLESR